MGINPSTRHASLMRGILYEIVINKVISVKTYEIRAVFSLLFLTLRGYGYNVTKKVWYSRNVADDTKTSKMNARKYSRDY